MLSLRSFPLLDGVPGLRHAVTTRLGGVSRGAWSRLNLGLGTGDDPAAVAENRSHVAETLGFPALLTPHQVHGTRITPASPDVPRAPETDGLTVATTGVLVGVLGADCPGVLLVDPHRRALAVVHAGWRGTVAGIVAEAVRTLAVRHGSRPGDLLAGIGPGISGPRYEVGPEVVAGIRAAGLDAPGVVRAGAGDRAYVDLAAAIRAALLTAGLEDAHVQTMDACTYDDAAAFFSHRRDGAGTGRHALVAGWVA